MPGVGTHLGLGYLIGAAAPGTRAMCGCSVRWLGPLGMRDVLGCDPGTCPTCDGGVDSAMGWRRIGCGTGHELRVVIYPISV